MKKKMIVLMVFLVAFILSMPCEANASWIDGEPDTEDEPVFDDKRRPATDLIQVNDRGMSYSKEDGTYYFDVTEEKVGEGSIFITGCPTADLDMVIEVKKGGVVGEAKCLISLDVVESVAGEIVSDYEVELENTGVILHFFSDETTDEFAAGDKFFAHLTESFYVSGNERSGGIVAVTGHPRSDHDIAIEILSDGVPGISKYKISLNDGQSTYKTDIIPVDHKAEIKDGMTIFFSPDEFVAESKYTSKVISNDREIDYTPVYVFIGIIVSIAIAFTNYMLSKKENASEYTLSVWKCRQEGNAYE